MKAWKSPFVARVATLAVALCAVGSVASSQSSIVHDTQTEFLPGAFSQTVLQGAEASPEIRLGTYSSFAWSFQDENIDGWTYATAGAGNLALEDPAGQIHLRASYATAEAYGLATRTNVPVPAQCVVEWRVYMDAIQPSDIGGVYNQPRGGSCRLDMQQSAGGLRIDIFADKMVSFYRNGTAGYDYPTLTSVDIVTNTGQWYTYRFEIDLGAMNAQVYRDNVWIGQFLAHAANAAGNTLRSLAYSRTSVSGLADFHIDSVRLGTSTTATYTSGTYTSDVLAVNATAFGPLSWGEIPAWPYPWGAWVKNPGNPILPATCLNENILCDIDDPLQQPILYGGYYWMCYADATHIRLAYTADPTLMTWTAYAGNPVLSPGLGPNGQEQYVYSPNLFKDGDTYYLFYDVSMAVDSRQRNAYATAPAPTGPWTKGQIILDRGAAGEWDDYRVSEPYVFRDGDTYFLYYMGDHVCSGCNEQVGLATTTAALFPLGPEPGGLWTKHGLVLPHNPSPTGWDRGLTADPSIIKVGDVFYMRYTGSYANEHWQLGTAWATDPYGPWQRPAAPDIQLGPAGSWDDDRLVRGAIHYHDGRWYSPYTGNDGGGYRGGIASADDADLEEYLSFETRTSPDGLAWEEWRAVSNGGIIQSTPDVYLQYRAAFAAAPGGASPTLTSVSLEFETIDAALGMVPQASGPISCAQTQIVTFRYVPTGPGTPPLRGFAVRVQASSELLFTIPDVTTTLPGMPDGVLLVTQNGPNDCTVNYAVLGVAAPIVGETDLFSIVCHGAASGTGTVSIVSAQLRDPTNQPISAELISPATISVDCAAPAAPADLQASQVLTGNPPGQTTGIDLTWTAIEPGASLRLFRKGFGNYPEYDDEPGAGAVPTVPGTPAAALAEGWALAVDTTDPAYTDLPGTRDFWYYVAFAIDGVGNASTPSNMTAGTLGYHLGDVFDGATAGTGDNDVEPGDVTQLGAGYGTSEGEPGYAGYLDVGPTTDASTAGRPTTDNQVEFEDLMMFALNFDQVSKDLPAPIPATENQLRLLVPDLTAVAERFTVALHLTGDARIHGLSAAVRWNADVVELLSVGEGELLAAQGGRHVLLTPAAGVIDAALLGASRSGIAGEGVLARLQFAVRASGDPGFALGETRARDADNDAVALAGETVLGVSDPAEIPRVAALHACAPNPFNPQTTIRFDLPHAERVRLRVFDVSGRLVASLLDQPVPAGRHAVVWTGRSDGGGAAASGLYFYAIEAGQLKATRKMMLLK